MKVTRSMGDIRAKFPQLGGNPKVLIAVPEIKKYTVSPEELLSFMGFVLNF